MKYCLRTGKKCFIQRQNTEKVTGISLFNFGDKNS